MIYRIGTMKIMFIIAIYCFFFLLEIQPPFPSRDVNVRKGVNPKDHYDMVEEIGR